jgi:hypothetical protein
MADRLLFMTFEDPVRGLEERAIEVFNDAVGLLGRKQQEGAIESFDVVLLDPNGMLGGFMVARGSAAQIHALREDAEFMRNTMDAQLCVNGIRHLRGYCNEGIASQMELYQSAISRASQHA